MSEFFYGLRLTTDAAAEPVSTADMKTFLAVTTTAHDAMIAALIKGARKSAEKFMGRALINQTWTLMLDAWPDCGTFFVPYPELRSITSLKYIDVGGTLQTLTENTDYTVDVNTEPGRVIETYATTFPAARNTVNAIQLVYVAGYGSASTDVPDDIITAIQMMVAHYYEHREEFTSCKITEVPTTKRLLAPYKIHWGI